MIFEPSSACNLNILFLQEVEEAFTFWGTPEGDLVHPAECMQQLLEKVRRHRVNVDGNVCTVLVTTLVLEVIFFRLLFAIVARVWHARYKRKYCECLVCMVI